MEDWGSNDEVVSSFGEDDEIVADWGGDDEVVQQEGDFLDKAVGATTEFAEGTTGWGTELGAIGAQLGGSVYDVLNTDKSLGEIMENFSGENLDAAFERVRGSQDRLEESNPMLSDGMAVGGMVAGLGVPAATLSKGSKLAKASIAAAEGAAYGAGSDDDRLTGALLGGAVGGGVGYGAAKLSDYFAQVRKADDADAGTQAEAMSEILEDTEWEDVGGVMSAFDEYAVGISDAIGKKVSPEMGGRVQRADETAMRQRTKDTKEILENKPMQSVIKLAEDDKEFKGLMLDFAQGATSQASVVKQVREELGPEAAQALSKYFKWSWKNNAKYNKRLGERQSAVNYLHTQKTRGLPGSKPLSDAENAADYVGFRDDELNMAADLASKDRVRGLASKGEVNVDEYANPFLTNANRVFNNQRLMELQDKIGVGDLDGGANALMSAIEKKAVSKGINEQGARDARNAIAHLVKGQNKTANAWLRAYQNSVYGATLAGPKSAVLNFHDIPVALWNNGVKNARGLVNKEIKGAADVERLGIDGQNVGEFVQEMRKAGKGSRTAGEAVADITKSATDKLMRASFFASADRIAKNRVLRIAGQDAVSRAKQGNLAERWGTYFDGKELTRLQSAISSSNGNISKMSQKDADLFDELLTLSLGQQQLISAAGRPAAWMKNPNLRPLYMMRGFAIKHNHLISEKVLGKLKKGDKAGAAKEAAAYIALPGTGYAGLNLARQEVAGSENYEASGEEFMYSLLDSVLGPVTMNSVGVGSSYERKELADNPVEKLMTSMLPPGGYTETVGKAISKTIREEDPAELAALVTDLPIYKQWERMLDN